MGDTRWAAGGLVDPRGCLAAVGINTGEGLKWGGFATVLGRRKGKPLCWRKAMDAR